MVCGLLKFYWDNQHCVVVVVVVVVVARSWKYHGTVFLPTQDTTQEINISPTLFNILVDAVVRKWYANAMDDMINDICQCWSGW